MTGGAPIPSKHAATADKGCRHRFHKDADDHGDEQRKAVSDIRGEPLQRGLNVRIMSIRMGMIPTFAYG